MAANVVARPMSRTSRVLRIGYSSNLLVACRAGSARSADWSAAGLSAWFSSGQNQLRCLDLGERPRRAAPDRHTESALTVIWAMSPGSAAGKLFQHTAVAARAGRLATNERKTDVRRGPVDGYRSPMLRGYGRKGFFRTIVIVWNFGAMAPGSISGVWSF
jgi:hypothetical protein